MSMLPDIINALTLEMKNYFNSVVPGTVILDTELGGDITAQFPLCILEISDAPESARLPGNGISRQDWNFALRIYAFEPNAYSSDDSGYSAGLLQILDDLRVYMCNETWVKAEMKALITNYGFRLTYTGTARAESLDIADKIAMGYKLMFETIAFDSTTLNNTEMKDDSGTISGEVDFVLPGSNDIPVPDAPVAIAAVDILTDGFTAGWNAVSGVNGYLVDVAADELFTDLIDFNIDVFDGLLMIVAGLDPDTDYYYRVRSYTDVSVSVNSNVIKVTTASEE